MIIRVSAEEMREPLDSNQVTVRLEQADGCLGEWCGLYHEEYGEPLKPRAHSHMVLTGHDPATTERCCPVFRN